MPASRTQIHFLPVDRSTLRAFQTGVSLHSHTEHSREQMRTMPRYLEQSGVAIARAAAAGGGGLRGEKYFARGAAFLSDRAGDAGAQ